LFFFPEHWIKPEVTFHLYLKVVFLIPVSIISFVELMIKRGNGLYSFLRLYWVTATALQTVWGSSQCKTIKDSMLSLTTTSDTFYFAAAVAVAHGVVISHGSLAAGTLLLYPFSMAKPTSYERQSMLFQRQGTCFVWAKRNKFLVRQE